MARRRDRPRREPEPLPPPLPPETRTVGQLVAETIRFYRHHFFHTVPLGLSVAILTQLSVEFGRQRTTSPVGFEPTGSGATLDFVLRPAHNADRLVETGESVIGGDVLLTATLGSLLLTASYVVATIVVARVRPDVQLGVRAYVAGVLAFLPVPFLALFYLLPAVIWLAFVGLVVPVILIEGEAIAAGFARATRLARADFVHAVGGLATLVILYVVTRLLLFFLLRNAGESTERAASFLADLVLSPILFVGAVLLYYDQAARLALREERAAAVTSA